MTQQVHALVEDVSLFEASRLGNDILGPLDAIREHAPLFWSERSQCWFVTRHADILTAFRGEIPVSTDRLAAFSFSSIPPEEQEKRIPNLLKYGGRISVNLDPPAHTRIRKLLMKAFSRPVVENIRGFARERVSSLIDVIDRGGGLVEFNEMIARPLPASVILRLIGLPDHLLPRMQFWTNAFLGALASIRPDPKLHDVAEAATIEMRDIVLAEIADRRRSPKGDLLSEMVRAREANDAFTEEELVAAVILLVVAGNDTTSNTMSLILAALAEHPESWEWLHRNPDRMLDGVNELMRYIAMAFCQPRIATKDFEWHGQQIRGGQILMLLQGVGNRDPRMYPDGDRIDFLRSANEQQLTFGPGLHYCLGHLLAKMQLCEFFSALVARYERVEILDDHLAWMPQIAFRGLFSLNAKFTARNSAA